MNSTRGIGGISKSNRLRVGMCLIILALSIKDIQSRKLPIFVMKRLINDLNAIKRFNGENSLKENQYDYETDPQKSVCELIDKDLVDRRCKNGFYDHPKCKIDVCYKGHLEACGDDYLCMDGFLCLNSRCVGGNGSYKQIPFNYNK